MRNNSKTVLQILIATAVAIGVVYLKKQVNGPGGGMVPGLLGFFIAWLLIHAVSGEVARLRRRVGDFGPVQSSTDSDLSR